ncbi:MAG: hypothetical protein WCK67_03210 [bacterium]
MNKRVFNFAVLVYLLNSQVVMAEEVLLETGTRITLRLTNPVDEDIKVEYITVIKEASPTYGLVNEALPA